MDEKSIFTAPAPSTVLASPALPDDADGAGATGNQNMTADPKQRSHSSCVNDFPLAATPPGQLVEGWRMSNWQKESLLRCMRSLSRGAGQPHEETAYRMQLCKVD